MYELWMQSAASVTCGGEEDLWKCADLARHQLEAAAAAVEEAATTAAGCSHCDTPEAQCQ
jgi:hypothetical protein